jgi:hypothetical protein
MFDYTIKKTDMLEALKVSPVTVAMAIPGCNSGELINRGGHGAAPESRGDDMNEYLYRGCVEHSDLLASYKDNDIVMSDEVNNCKTLLPFNFSFDISKISFTHDTVIVGHGSTGIVQWWLVK